MFLLTTYLANASVKLNLYEIFQAAPIIYLILSCLSLFSFVIWLYSLLTLKTGFLMPERFIQEMRQQFEAKEYEAALKRCQRTTHFSALILARGLNARSHGHQVMVEAMQMEGKRCGVNLWQRLSLLNEVAVIAPMIGLLGTVWGLFHAFYDMNRSSDTLAAIFDGLGIAVGTTVVGLIVAILAMIFHVTLKFRVIRLLSNLETETLALGSMIETP